jgi:signal transduction histidine kinase
LSQVKKINEDLTVLEENFSFVLGEGSRWLEYVVLSLLTLAVLTVETIGLSLAYTTSRAISKGLSRLIEAANKIGSGDFTQKIDVQSSDEIGKLSAAVNTMGEMLQKSYGDLEKRVNERTSDLKKMATENERLYEEAKAAVLIRDEFLSIASHELKTPLTALYIQLQQQIRFLRNPDKQADSQKISDISETSLRLTKRIIALLDELLDLTRLRIGKFELHKENCDLIPLVTEVISALKNEADRKGSSIILHGDSKVMGSFDSSRVGQVVTNLLSNAIKYGAGKPIEVKIQNEGAHCVIGVRDNGVGIPQDQQGKIFERFERGKVNPAISGLGLGLYIINQIVKAHGGSITVESYPGKGSTFTVRL